MSRQVRTTSAPNLPPFIIHHLPTLICSHTTYPPPYVHTHICSHTTYPPPYVHTPPTHPHMFTHHLPTHTPPTHPHMFTHHLPTHICSHTTYPPPYVHTTHIHVHTLITYVHTHISPDVPDAPTDVSLHVSSNRTLTVKFSEPVHSRGAPITRYKSK